MKIKEYYFTFFIFCSIFGFSQPQNDTIKSKQLVDVVVSSQRFTKQKRTISQQIESISKNEIEFQNYQTSADVLQNSGKLYVQKSQQGGGSPIVRGFEASRILMIVDGVRMNNLIYRTGHLQNSITVDKNILENVDILFGPSSTIYGSDALGGVIYFKTKDAKVLSELENNKFLGNIITNYSSVNEGKTGHFDLNIASKKMASLSSFSYNDFGDLRMGKQRNGSNDFFGERDYYVETINGIDIKVANDDKYIQKKSGYKQYDFMQKILFNQDNGLKHIFNLQYSTTTNIPRYDRLTDMNGTNFSSAEWYYGPQKRLLAIYKLSKQKTFLNSDMNISISYQNIEESRMNRNFGNPNLNSRIEKVAVFGLTADFKTKFNKTDFVYGIDFYYDDLSSIANKKNLLTGAESALNTRYPDGKNNSISTEGFVYLNNQFAEKMSYNFSFRAGYKLLKSEILTNYLNLPYTNIEQKNFTYSGAIGFVNNPSKHTKIALNLASAFRVPNIDDLGKIFDSKAGTLIVPNSDIKPEKTVTADLSITLWDGGNFMIENTIFITKLFDPILTDKFLLNGQSTTLYNPNGTTATVSQIYANQNQGKGTITGLSATIKASLTKSLKGYGNVNISKGNTENQSGNFPLDHIAPVYGKIGLGFDNQKLTADLYMLYSGNKNIQSYAPSGEDNLQYAPIGGTKAWETYNFKIGVKIQKSINLFSGIENILDTQYRNFASGINAAGRNIYFGAKYGF